MTYTPFTRAFVTGPARAGPGQLGFKSSCERGPSWAEGSACSLSIKMNTKPCVSSICRVKRVYSSKLKGAQRNREVCEQLAEQMGATGYSRSASVSKQVPVSF